MSNPRNSRNLNQDQQRLLNMYINQYSQANSQIEQLLDIQDEIRNNISNIINTNQFRRARRQNRNTNNNFGINRLLNQFFNDIQDNNVYYDYNNPIDLNFVEPMRTQPTFSRNTNSHYPFDDFIRGRPRNSQQSEINRNLFDIFFQAVEVRPTQAQIDNASRVIRYSDIVNPLSETCPISLERFNPNDEVRQILPCGHLFHQQEFQEWFQHNVRCPVCRYDIRNFRPLSRRNTPQETSGSSSETQETVRTETQPPVSNVNVERNPVSNEIDQISFDINDPAFTEDIINLAARNIFQSILNPSSRNPNERFMIDPSNNMLFYETIIRPNNSNTNPNPNNNS